jgi:hypothetical protein
MEKPEFQSITVYKSVKKKEGQGAGKWYMKELGQTDFNPWNVETIHPYHGDLIGKGGGQDTEEYYMVSMTSSKEYIIDSRGYTILQSD